MKPGSTIYVYHTGFLPAMIRFHMKLWRFIIGKKYTLPWNHTEKVVPITMNSWNTYFQDDYGQPSTNDIISISGTLFILMACSARAKGAEMTPLSVYLKDHPVHQVKQPVIDLTLIQANKLERYAIAMCFIYQRKYEKMMFLKWIKRIQTLGGYNPRHTDDREVYCFEIVNEFDRMMGLAPDRDGLVDIYQLWENPNFK